MSRYLAPLPLGVSIPEGFTRADVWDALENMKYFGVSIVTDTERVLHDSFLARESLGVEGVHVKKPLNLGEVIETMTGKILDNEA